ncbi:MAG: hypothetical protein KBT20_10520 [Bacteroidales bacterium]|nr:hypothetical protein [Candidatus Liminaster caballi]
MKRISALIVTALSALLPSVAQITQSGRVLEYQGKEAKTSLPNVSIAVAGAGATVSNADGEYQLQFRVLHAGDKVNVRRIERSGYEVMNPTLLDQWYIASNGQHFNIVMCSTEHLARIRDSYRELSSSSYTRNLEAAEQALADKRSRGQISEEDFNARIEELENQYEQQLSQIETYIDRFARIDLSELNSIEQQVIDLVKQGRFEDAIALYEKENLIGKLQQQSQDKQQLVDANRKITASINEKQQTIDSLYSAIDRQVDLLGMAGGTDNYAKMGEILRQSYEVDTTNVRRILRYGDYLKLQGDYSGAFVIYEKAARQPVTNPLLNIEARTQVVSMMTMQQEYDEPLRQFPLLIDELCDNCDTTSANVLDVLYTLQTNMSMTAFRMKHDSVTLAYNSEMIQTAQRIADINPARGQRLLAAALFRLGNNCMGMSKYEEGKVALEKAMQIIPTLSNVDYDPELNLPRAQGIYAQICLSLEDIEAARKYSDLAIRGSEQRYQRNPAGNLYPLATMQFQAAILHFSLQETDECMRYIDAAIDSFTILASKQPKAFGSYLEKIKQYREIFYTELTKPQKEEE